MHACKQQQQDTGRGQGSPRMARLCAFVCCPHSQRSKTPAHVTFLLSLVDCQPAILPLSHSMRDVTHRTNQSIRQQY